MHLSADGKTWSAPAAKGTWPNDPTFKFVALPGDVARYASAGWSDPGPGPVLTDDYSDLLGSLKP